MASLAGPQYLHVLNTLLAVSVRVSGVRFMFKLVGFAVTIGQILSDSTYMRYLELSKSQRQKVDG